MHDNTTQESNTLLQPQESQTRCTVTKVLLESVTISN